MFRDSLSGALPTAKATAEAGFKATGELVEAIQQTISTKRAFEVQLATEEEQSAVIKTRADGTLAPPQQLRFYVGHWPWQWDFYLYRIEILRLNYEKAWLGFIHNRRPSDHKVLTLRQPLFSIRFFEPQDEASVVNGLHTPDVNEPETVTITELSANLPDVEFPLLTTIEHLATIAFPITAAEKREAAVRKTGGSTGRTAPAKRPAAKKPAARKAVAGKSTAKRPPDRKVTIKVSSAKRPLSGKAPTRKAATKPAKQPPGRKPGAKK